MSIPTPAHRSRAIPNRVRASLACIVLAMACNASEQPNNEVEQLRDTIVEQAQADTAYFEGSRRLWEDARERGVRVRAIGQEPGWLLEIFADRIMLSVDYDTRRVTAPTPEAVIDAAARTTTWHTTSGGNDLRITVHEDECTDVMSGEQFPLTVVVVLDRTEYLGCGRALQPTP